MISELIEKLNLDFMTDFRVLFPNARSIKSVVISLQSKYGILKDFVNLYDLFCMEVISIKSKKLYDAIWDYGEPNNLLLVCSKDEKQKQEILYKSLLELLENAVERNAIHRILKKLFPALTEEIDNADKPNNERRIYGSIYFERVFLQSISDTFDDNEFDDFISGYQDLKTNNERSKYIKIKFDEYFKKPVKYNINYLYQFCEKLNYYLKKNSLKDELFDSFIKFIYENIQTYWQGNYEVNDWFNSSYRLCYLFNQIVYKNVIDVAKREKLLSDAIKNTPEIYFALERVIGAENVLKPKIGEVLSRRLEDKFLETKQNILITESIIKSNSWVSLVNGWVTKWEYESSYFVEKVFTYLCIQFNKSPLKFHDFISRYYFNPFGDDKKYEQFRRQDFDKIYADKHPDFIKLAEDILADPNSGLTEDEKARIKNFIEKLQDNSKTNNLF